MRIKENTHHNCELYSCGLQERVVDVFQYVSQIVDVKKLIDEIKEECLNLRGLFWTEQELKEKNESVNFFDERMQATVYYTLKNIEGYQEYGWKQLIYEGENGDERDEFIQEKK